MSARIDAEKGEQFRNHFTAGQLAAFLNVTTRTVRRWVADDVIPQPAARSGNGWNLWTPEQAAKILDWRLGKVDTPK